MRISFFCWAIIFTVFVNNNCAIYLQDIQGLFGNNLGQLSKSSQLITHQKREKEMSQNLISAEIEPFPNKANQAAKTLHRLGFKILHIGSTISVEAQRSLWESTFSVSFQKKKKITIAEIESEVIYLSPITDSLSIPEELKSLIAEVMFVEPPEFY